jgi:serine/threonine protein kinase
MSDEAAIPEQIDRYLIESILGEGGFGRVYLAFDTVLERSVSLKVLHKSHMTLHSALDTYFAEARILASLDHPHIVPIFDAQQTDNGEVFLVWKYIEGEDLRSKMLQKTFPHKETAAIIARIAEALDYAHQKELVHRDVKPANILIGTDQTPYLIDFGISLLQEDWGKTWQSSVGTPRYMSPEQLRGEGHRLDGRSDIYSIGVVLYELLTGTKTYLGPTLKIEDGFEDIEIIPPRAVDKSIPRELERICQLCIAKLPRNRYQRASELADDLLHFIAAHDQEITLKRAENVIPKGLHSFNAADSEFFLRLLPGPHDRHGLPDCIRFWKSRIEETDPNKAFKVGLIYGESGCGKSSLVKAGILPRLDPRVTTIYVEAASGQTDRRLLAALRKEFPELTTTGTLSDAIRDLRLNKSTSKILIVIDQFEQWLHAHPHGKGEKLVNALRQCDGTNVQCILLVRDDFWLPVSQFMDDLEVPILSNENAAAVDLFDPQHARFVLSEFGRGYGKLPSDSSDITKDQQKMLARAVDDLSTNGKVIPVRLALFAEMFKNREWSTSTLKDLGGAGGIAITFLEDALGGESKDPKTRRHSEATRRVFQALLPKDGSVIKKAAVEQSVLVEASGYAADSTDFRDLIQVLDSDLRLITPVDSPGANGNGQSPHLKHYQLTHDYLVMTICDWLNRKQKETRRGRAELCLEERGALWSVKKEKRHLPSFFETTRILALTRRSSWTDSQQEMMKSAKKSLFLKCSQWAIIIIALTNGAWHILGHAKAKEHLARMETMQTSRLSEVLPDLRSKWNWAEPLIRKRLPGSDSDEEKYAPNSRQHLNAELSLLANSEDTQRIDHLADQWLLASAEDFSTFSAVLKSHFPIVKDRFWQRLNGKDAIDSRERLHLYAALAVHDPDNPDWQKKHSEEFIKLLFARDVPQFVTWIRAIADSDFLQRRLIELYDTPKPPTIDIKAEVLKTFTENKAKAAIALYFQDQPEHLWRSMSGDEDPAARLYLIHHLKETGINPITVFEKLKTVPDPATRRSLISCLGEYDASDFEPSDFAQTLEVLDDIFRTDEDGSVHSMAQWALKRWEKPGVDPKGTQKKGWFTNKSGITMLIVPVNGRNLAVSATEVTYRQFSSFRFKDSVHYEEFESESDWPIAGVSIYDAMQFCNFLSKEEGHSQCYREVPGSDGKEMEPLENIENLDGYRLPLEVEWEAAAELDPFFGPSQDLAGSYGWTSGNANRHPHPVGKLKPNDFGIFDMLGNLPEFIEKPKEKKGYYFCGAGYATDLFNRWPKKHGSSNMVARTNSNSIRVVMNAPEFFE